MAAHLRADDGRPVAAVRQRLNRVEHSVRAAVGIARDHGLDADDPLVLEDSSNTLVWMRPAPVVARVAALTALMRSDGGAAHLRREADVATYLSGCGAPVLGPSPLLPAGPHERDGRWMTFWPHVDHDDSRAIAVEEAATLLRQVHGALA